MDNNLRREIILDNYQNPMNRGLVSDNDYVKFNTNSESCIDNLDFMMKINNDIIVNLPNNLKEVIFYLNSYNFCCFQLSYLLINILSSIFAASCSDIGRRLLITSLKWNKKGD